MSSKNKSKNFLAISLSISASILLVTGIVYATTIGTDINTSNLTVSGSATFSGLGTDMLAIFNSSNQLVSSSTPTAAAYFATSTTATSTFAGGFNTGGSSGIFVLQNGNVGIGVANPRGKLELGSAPTWTSSAFNKNLVVGLDNSTNNAIAFAGTPGSYSAFGIGNTVGFLDFFQTSNLTQTNTAPSFFMTFSQNGGIGIAAPGGTAVYPNSSNSLDIGGATVIGSYAGNNAGPSNGLAVSGRVGIGTTTPASLLSVQGNGLISGLLTVGNINATSSIGVATSSPSAEISATGSATTTLYLNSSGSKGACIELLSSTSTTWRLYAGSGANATNGLVFEPGSCK